jgi:hypothetical protein
MSVRVLLWNYLLIAPHVLLGVVFIALLRRRLYRQFPIFTAYIATEIAQFAVLFAMIKSPSTTGLEYGIAYSFGLALSTALRLGILHEIFAHMFRNYSALSRFGRPLFRWATVGLLLAGLGLAAYAGGHDPDRLMSIVYVLDRTASILQCGLLMGLFLFSSYLGLSWRSYIFGIALGLGVFASTELVASAIRSQTGFTYSTYLDYLTMGTYHGCVLVWAFYLWAPERISQYALKSVPDHDMETWNRELQRLLGQ